MMNLIYKLLGIKFQSSSPFRKETISELTVQTQKGVMYEWCEVSDQSHNLFFSDHYMKVRRAREKDCVKSTEVENHPLVGKKIIITNDEDGREVWVESVHKHWYMGYYLVALYYTIMDNGGHSHGTRAFENINCHCPCMLDDIEENQKSMKIS